jgi:transposase
MAAVHGPYDAPFKHRVLQYYKPGVRGHGARATASRFLLPDHSLVLQWAAQWDGTVESLERKVGSGRKRKLTHEESTTHIEEFVRKRNKAGISTSYKEVKAEVESKTGKTVSLRTVQRIGREDHNITNKFCTRKLAIESRIRILLLPNE